MPLLNDQSGIQQKINIPSLYFSQWAVSRSLGVGMSKSFERQTISFVVRLWVEPRQGKPHWRGQIERVGSGEKAYFQDVASLLDTLAKLAPYFVSADAKKEEEP